MTKIQFKLQNLIDRMEDKDNQQIVKEFVNVILQVTPSNINSDVFLVESLDERFKEQKIEEIDEFIKEQKKLFDIFNMKLPTIFNKLDTNILVESNIPVHFQQAYDTLKESLNNGSLNVYTAFNRLYDILVEYNNGKIRSFDDTLSLMEQFTQKNRENIEISSYVMMTDVLDAKSNEMINDLVESYVLQDSKNDEFRNHILEALSPFTSVSTKARAISDSIKKFMKQSFNVASRDNFVVEDLYSFVRISNNKDRMLFGNKKNLFEMNLETFEIQKIMDEVNEGFVEILDLNNFINNGRNFVSENGTLNFHFNNDNLELSMADDKKVAKFNGKIVENNFVDFFNDVSKMNMIRNKNKILRIYEKLDSLMNIDFAKNIYTKDNSAHTTIFHFGDRFYADMINHITETNKFLVDADASQLHSEMLEFMGFDLQDTLNEFMNPINQTLNVYNTQLNVVNDNITKVENMIETLEEHINSDKLESLYNNEINVLHNNLLEELNDLKREKSLIQKRILEIKKPAKNIVEQVGPSLGEKYFGHLKEDKLPSEKDNELPDDKMTRSTVDLRSKKIRPNMSVYIKDINKQGVITGVNTVLNLVTITTLDAQTLTYKMSEVGKNIELIAGDVIDNLDKMVDKADDLQRQAAQLQKESVNESISPKGVDIFTGWGVEGKFASKLKQNVISDKVFNEGTQILKDDKATLNSIINKLDNCNNIFGEVENFLNSYRKINGKPISDILQQIDSFKQALQGELDKLDK